MGAACGRLTESAPTLWLVWRLAGCGAGHAPDEIFRFQCVVDAGGRKHRCPVDSIHRQIAMPGPGMLPRARSTAVNRYSPYSFNVTRVQTDFTHGRRPSSHPALFNTCQCGYRNRTRTAVAVTFVSVVDCRNLFGFGGTCTVR